MPNVDKGAPVRTMYEGKDFYDERDPHIAYSFPPNSEGNRLAVEAYRARFGREPEQIEYSLGLWRCWPAEVRDAQL